MTTCRMSLCIKAGVTILILLQCIFSCVMAKTLDTDSSSVFQTGFVEGGVNWMILFVSAGDSNIEHGIEGMENSRIRGQESQGRDIQHLRSGCSTGNCTCGREDVWAAVLQQQAWRSFNIKCMFRPQISIYQHRVLFDYMPTRAMSDWQQSKCKVGISCMSYELQFLYMWVPVLPSLKLKRFASVKTCSSYQEENHNSGCDSCSYLMAQHYPQSKI